MSTLKVNKLRDTAGSTDAIVLDPNGGAVLAGVTTISTARITTGITTSIQVGGGVTISESGIEASGIGITCANINGGQISGRRNLVINGAMMVAQRGTSTTGLQNSGGVFTIDRFPYRRYGTWSNALFKHEQVNSGTGLFKKALKVTTTTAEGSATSGDKTVMIGHYLEAQDSIAAFGDGTAEAKSFTVSFYVKASIATTYSLHLSTGHLSTEKAYVAPFTVNSASTWERKTITFPAITNSISTIDGSDTSSGLKFHWVLDAATGSNSANTYVNYTSGDFKYPTGQSPSGFANTLNATFELSGVQLEVGSQATAFEHRSFGEELTLCQRYYQFIDYYSNTGSASHAYKYAENISYYTEMRATPTFSSSARGSNSGTASPSAWSASGYLSQYHCSINVGSQTHAFTGRAILDAEL